MKVYFYCLPPKAGRRPAYQFQLVYLAEGLQSLGVPIFANIDYWKIESDQYLFRHDPTVGPHDCDVAVISSIWRDYGGEFPPEIFAADRRFLTVCIDTFDGLFTSTFEPASRGFDVILKQTIRGLDYPGNVVSSWTFGLGQFVIDFLAEPKPWAERVPAMMVNFRNLHPLRELAERRFLDRLPRPWQVDPVIETRDYAYRPEALGAKQTYFDLAHVQSGQRHHPEYLRRLQAGWGVAAFGGYILPHRWWLASPARERWSRYVYRHSANGRLVEALRRWNLTINDTRAVYQWDSWRLWEGWAAGAVVFHVDFDLYGIEMPVMPQNWVHYVGIDLRKPEQSLGRLQAMTADDLRRIALEGRQWALAHYSPLAVANRFVALLSRYL